MATKTKLMICLMAFSVALTGYLSCLIASHIHQAAGLVSAPAVLPGLSFGLVIGAWLLHRGWISRRRAVGLAAGSAVAYFAAYWSAFYIVTLCGDGMISPTLRLPLFHAGMIAGLVGTTLLIATLAAISADFRGKDWKTLVLIGAAAGGALCLAGIGASANDRPGTLANPGDIVFILVWQLLVSGYLGILLLAAPSVSAPVKRGRFAHRAARAVLVLLAASFVQAAIGYSRGDKKTTATSAATSGSSNVDPGTPQGPKDQQKSAKASSAETLSTAKLRQAAENFSLGRYEEAFDLYKEVITSDPQNPKAYLARGWAFFCTNQKDAALRDYEEAIRLGPKDAEGYFRRGLVLATTADSGRAITDFSKAIECSSRFAEAYFQRGILYYVKKEIDRAFNDFDASIRLKPEHAAAYLARGRCFRDQNKLTAAIADFSQAIKLDPQGAAALVARAQATFQSTNNFDLALKDLQTAIKVRPSYAATYFQLADLYASRKQDALAALTLGQGYFYSLDNRQAIANYDKAIVVQPGLVEAHFERGRAAFRQAILEPWGSAAEDKCVFEARESLRQVLALDPKNADAELELGKITFYRGQGDGGLPAFDNAIGLRPHFSEAYFRRGIVKCLYRDEYQEAIKDFDKTIDLAPNHGGAYFFRAFANASLERHELVAKDYERAIELTPGGLQYPEFARIYEDPAHFVDFIWQRLIGVSIKASEYFSRGIWHIKAGRSGEGMADVNRAVKLAPNEGRLILARAVLNEALGRSAEASADFRRAARLGTKTELTFRGRQYTVAGVRQREIHLSDGEKAAAVIAAVIAGAILVDVLAGDSMSAYSTSSENMPGYIEPSWTMFMTDDEVDRDAGGWRY